MNYYRCVERHGLVVQKRVVTLKLTRLFLTLRVLTARLDKEAMGHIASTARQEHLRPRRGSISAQIAPTNISAAQVSQYAVGLVNFFRDPTVRPVQ